MILLLKKNESPAGLFPREATILTVVNYILNGTLIHTLTKMCACIFSVILSSGESCLIGQMLIRTDSAELLHGWSTIKTKYNINSGWSLPLRTKSLTRLLKHQFWRATMGSSRYWNGNVHQIFTSVQRYSDLSQRPCDKIFHWFETAVIRSHLTILTRTDYLIVAHGEVKLTEVSEVRSWKKDQCLDLFQEVINKNHGAKQLNARLYSGSTCRFYF